MIIDRIWRSQPGKFFCLSTKSASGKWRDHFFPRRKIRTIEAFIKRNADKDIYFCPHGFSEERRLKKFAMLPKLMWSDLDEADPRELDIKPTIAIESSPGRFVGLWFIDKDIDEEVNRALSYHIGADKGGWDLTQVLRVPGTTNFKYESLPRIKILWSDGPTYKLKDIKKRLPEPENDETEVDEVMSIFRKHERRMPHWVRRELMNGRPQEGKRSEMIWKLCNTLIESGLHREEVFLLLKASPWNKFKGRRSEDDQLEREIDKATSNHLRAKPKSNKETKPYKFLTESMADVEIEEIDWIWYPYLALGELTILEGDPGLGKSYVAQMAGAAIVDGNRLPSVKKLDPIKGKVAYFDIENSRGSVTKPRLVQNGCKNLDKFFQDEQPFSIDDPERLDEVFEAIERLNPVLVVFDTLNTYIGKADTYKAAETQQALGTFREIAKRFHCAVMVLRHLTKSSKEKALYRGQGSIAFAGLARVVITVGVAPDDPETKVMAVTKLNVTRKPKALTFHIDYLPDTLKEKDRSKFAWGDFVELTSDDIISAPPEKGKSGSSERDSAEEFLKDVLAEGPLEKHRIEKIAETRSISIRTLYRASESLGIVRKTKGFGDNKISEWSLPE